MFLKIKNAIEKELKKYIRGTDELYTLSKISPVLFRNIKDFISRSGKRIRPILFVASYLGFAKKIAPGLYRSALAIEMLHDFMLVHDDIIDKSAIRRRKPSMHALLNKYLLKYKNIKFNGQDLAIVAGDVIYAMAIHAFLSIKENLKRKEKALRMLIDAAMYTGSGEFIELLAGLKNMDKITKKEIYRIYDFKTAYYTFATPLAMGAELSGINKEQIDLIFKYGMYCGRAFQIKDDILGIFGDEKKTGKPTLTDLQEAKKTILIWHAYNNSKIAQRNTIKKIFAKQKVNWQDLLQIKRIIIESGSLQYACNEIDSLLKEIKRLNLSSHMRQPYKTALYNYFQELLRPPAVI